MNIALFINESAEIIEYENNWGNSSEFSTTIESDFNNANIPVTIEGNYYNSIADAANALNISYNTVYNRLHSKNYPNWQICD